MKNILDAFDNVVSENRNDLIFEGRNKLYGAYAIRSTYNNTLVKSMAIACALVFGLCMFQKRGTPNAIAARHTLLRDTITITNAPNKKEEISKPKNSNSSSSSVAGLTILVGTRNDTFSSDSASISGTGIGKTGSDTGGFFNGPGNGKDTTTVVKTTFVKPDERDATFAGGEAAFYKWFEKMMVYPEVAIENNSQGRVKIQFHVDEDGSLSNFTVVQDVSEAPELADEAIRVLKLSPKWTPASQNGFKVPAYRVIPIDFVLN